MNGAYVIAAFVSGGLMMLAVLVMGVRDRRRRREAEARRRTGRR